LRSGRVRLWRGSFLRFFFQTDFPKDGPTETWVVCRYEPPHLIEFVRVSSVRAIRYTITLQPTEGGKTEAEWRQVISGLCEEGDRLVEQGPAYVARPAPELVTEAMDRVCAKLGQPTDSFVSTASRRILERSEW